MVYGMMTSASTWLEIGTFSVLHQVNQTPPSPDCFIQCFVLHGLLVVGRDEIPRHVRQLVVVADKCNAPNIQYGSMRILVHA